MDKKCVKKKKKKARVTDTCRKFKVQLWYMITLEFCSQNTAD